MRQKYLLVAILLFFTTSLVVSAQQTTGIVPSCEGSSCRACDFMELGQNLLNWFVGITAVIVTLMFAWGGMQMLMSAGNTASVTAGREKMTNAIVGLVIVLASWLIVNTVLLVLTGGGLASWGKINCVPNPPRVAMQPLGGGGGIQAGSGSGRGVQCPPGNTACSTNSLMNSGFTAVQSQVMSCIAMTESSGNPNARSSAPNSSACGTFQVTRTTWNSVAKGACSDFSNCTNPSCNAQVAKTLVSKNGYKDWTCPGCNSKAQACIDKYGGGRI